MKVRTSLIISVLLSLGMGCLALIAVDAVRALNQPLAAEPETEALFTVGSGASLNQVAAGLHERGHIENARDKYYLSLLGRVSNMAGRIHVGEYDLVRHNTPWLLLQAMVRGDVKEYGFTIVEGWNLRQLLTALRASENLKQSEPPLDNRILVGEFGLEPDSAEGWFLPDTYHYPRGASDLSVLRRAHAAMRKALETEWEGRADELPYEKAYEALIMASIIEKETAVARERGQIAGVFVRRLQKGMRLQTDPTVIYGIGEKYDGNIRRRDLVTDTPYNTYVRTGLPPTPIAMPGRASIHAALHPEPGDSLYFVSRGDGSHVFSDNLEEHNAAVRKYQLGQGGEEKNESKDSDD